MKNLRDKIWMNILAANTHNLDTKICGFFKDNKRDLAFFSGNAVRMVAKRQLSTIMFELR